ncbi:MAG: hypothetical protein GOMPHAMPRED_003490 [Gomphillus americanus]|uniref:Uncharacterized protein n=1 Tax=Gomphillus americanus TaxID=1940652 RepID=A0A8H3IDE8_9LECA|nr:MAG: hypothetical protein GOMPHAMPRED_003490 [Gomphillus americanus]
MTVSTPVIVAITVLSCCLVITSALLVYKLRPDMPQQARKWSGQSSEPPSPVRKMMVVQGVVVDDDIPKPTRSLLPRWSTLYTSRRTSVVSSLRGRGSFILSSQVDLEAQLKHDHEKLPQVSIEEYLGFEKSRRARRFGGSRGSSIRIPLPLRLHRDSFSSDELRVSPDALSPKSLPNPTPAALSREGSMKITRKALPAVNSTEPIRRHSTPTNMQLKAPQTRGPFNIAFLKAASISALPPSAFSARATPEPSIRYSIPPTPDSHQRHNLELKLLLELENNNKIDGEESRLSRQRSRDLETIKEAPTGVDPACPSPIVRLKRSESKSRSRSRSVPRKIRESSLLQRLGRNRPPPIRLGAANMKDPSTPVKRQSTQQGTWSTPNSEIDDPIFTSSVPITPPVMSSNIVSIVPSYPAFIPSSIKDRQSMATIASSQYSPTFSLASAQQVPLFAGKLKPLGAHSMKPEVPPVPPLPDMAQSVPPTPQKIAAGLRKSIKSSTALEVSSFPKPPSSLRSSPLSPTFGSQLSPATKRVHIVSPLVNGDHHPPMPNATIPPTSTSTTSPAQEKPRRSSRYSHLIDKDLPPPPPTSSTTVEALLAAQQSQPPEPVPKQPPQDLQPQSQTASIQQPHHYSHPQPQSKRLSSSSSTITAKPLPPAPPSLSQLQQPQQQQQSKPPLQEPKPLIPHTRSQSLNSKATAAAAVAAATSITSTETEADPETQPLPVLPATHYIRDESQAHHHQQQPLQAATPLPTTSGTVSPITTTTPDQVHSRANSRANSKSRGAATAAAAAAASGGGHRRGRAATNATVSPLSEQFPAELKLNLDLAVGSELGIDFGRGMFGK